MILGEVNWRPDRRELRHFGFVCLIAFGALGAWLWFRHSIAGIGLGEASARTAAWVMWGLAALALAASLTASQALRPLYLTLTVISLPIGFVVSHALMAVVFFGVLTPVGLFFRLLGRDALRRRFERSARTYWQPRKIVVGGRQYFRQF